MFFKKGLRNPSLICKLIMKNPRTSEAMFTIANKYDLAEEATLDTREQEKEKDLGHVDQPSSSKGHDKKWEADRSVNAVEQSRCNKEYRPRRGEFVGFLDRICIFHPRESTRLRTAIDSKVSQMKYSRWPNGPIKRKRLKNQRATFPKLTSRSTTSTVAPILISQGKSRNSQLGRSCRSHPPPLST
jgi:hypothetical protein